MLQGFRPKTSNIQYTNIYVKSNALRRSWASALHGCLRLTRSPSLGGVRHTKPRPSNPTSQRGVCCTTSPQASSDAYSNVQCLLQKAHSLTSAHDLCNHTLTASGSTRNTAMCSGTCHTKKLHRLCRSRVKLLLLTNNSPNAHAQAHTRQLSSD